MTAGAPWIYNRLYGDIMNILTVENRTFNLNNLPDELEDEIRFAVLDNSNPTEPDFFFPSLVFLESFNSPAIVLKIGDSEVTLPIDWCIAVGDGSSDCDVEIIPLTSLNDRGFDALCINPISSFRLEFKPIQIVNFYNDVKWYFPKMKTGQLLSVPLSNKLKPECIFVIRDIARQCELIDMSRIL